MSLRARIRLVAALIRWTASTGCIATGLITGHLAIGLLAAFLWMLSSGPFLRHRLLPSLFPDTICPGCRRRLPLIGRWKCGDHYIDHRPRHILSFHCNQGHQLESFDCPRCKATILVQHGDRKLLRHGSAIRMRAVTPLPNQGLLIGHDRNRRSVRLPSQVLAKHAAIFGATGEGKSVLLEHLILQLIEQSGITVLDTGDLAPTLRNIIPAHRQPDIVYLNVADAAQPFPLNLLQAGSDLERITLVEELVEVFHRMYGSSWGPSLEHQLRMGLRAAMSAGGSLRDVYELFTSVAARTRILKRVTDQPAKQFWLNEFPTIPAIRRAAVVNKLAPIVFHPIVGPIIGARECVLNADLAIANRQIVIASLWTGSPADDVTGLIGTFLVQKIIAAAFRQGALPAAQRVPHVLLVDEFPRFIHNRAAAFDQVLAEARRYRLSLIIASQYVDQLDPPTRAAIFGNVGALISFRVGHKDARQLADEFKDSEPNDFTELTVGRCLARIGRDWNLVHTLPPTHPLSHSALVRPIVQVTEKEIVSPEPSNEESASGRGDELVT